MVGLKIFSEGRIMTMLEAKWSILDKITLGVVDV